MTKTTSPLQRNSSELRRRFLRGPGVAMALPWLESLPVWGAAPLAAATPPKRFAALFMGNGINPTHWWAKGSGADMELGKSLAPLAPLKAKLNVITGLFNKHATGVGIHPGQTGNILSGASLQKGPCCAAASAWTRCWPATSARRRSQPSLVLGCEQPITGYHETNFSMAYSSHISWQNADLAGADGGLSVAGLRQPVRQPRQPAQRRAFSTACRSRPRACSRQVSRSRPGEARRVPDQRPRSREARSSACAGDQDKAEDERRRPRPAGR